MSTGALSSAWAAYADTFRLHVHQLLAWAHRDARTRLAADLDEPSLTGLLAEAIRRRLYEDETTPEAYRRYDVHDQSPENPEGDLLGNERRRLDLSITCTGLIPRPVFTLEAKRLRTAGYPIGKYIGEGGMGDYISGRYAPTHVEAAMVGLIQNRDATYWMAELRRSFVEDLASAAPKLAILSSLVSVNVVAEIGGELESQHARVGRAPLRLFHIPLDCTSAGG
jgi:hypothetical protein